VIRTVLPAVQVDLVLPHKAHQAIRTALPAVQAGLVEGFKALRVILILQMGRPPILKVNRLAVTIQILHRAVGSLRLTWIHIRTQAVTLMVGCPMMRTNTLQKIPFTQTTIHIQLRIVDHEIR
jgi:hypothetical protein